MCNNCGCHPDHENRTRTINLQQSLLAANNKIADENRLLIEKMGAVAINLISSPGAGKTTLLEKTIDRIKDKIKIAVIEGDIETERDAARIRAKGVPVVQITTGGACHLDANLILRGINQLRDEFSINSLDLLIIENVGNLVCPAAFDLGEHKRMVILSVPEGSDKPAKYPAAFAGSDYFIISKTDLMPYFDFAGPEAIKEAVTINPHLQIMELSAINGQGMDKWITTLEDIINP